MPLFENFFRGHVWTLPEDVLVKFEVHIFNRIRAIGINAQKFRGSCDLAMIPFQKFSEGPSLDSL